MKKALYYISNNNDKLQRNILKLSKLQEHVSLKIINICDTFYLNQKYNSIDVTHSKDPIAKLYNHCIMDGFKNLKNPVNDIVTILCDETINEKTYLNTIDQTHNKYSFLCTDSLVSFTSDALVKTGLFDETFSSSSYLFICDYILRALLNNNVHSSINYLKINISHNPLTSYFIIKEYDPTKKNNYNNATDINYFKNKWNIDLNSVQNYKTLSLSGKNITIGDSTTIKDDVYTNQLVRQTINIVQKPVVSYIPQIIKSQIQIPKITYINKNQPINAQQQTVIVRNAQKDILNKKKIILQIQQTKTSTQSKPIVISKQTVYDISRLIKPIQINITTAKIHNNNNSSISGTYHIHNVKYDKYITAVDPTCTNLKGVIISDYPTKWIIYENSGYYSIKHSDESLINQYGSCGWNIYTLKDNREVLGAGNETYCARLKIEKIQENYVIKSMHTGKNIKGNNERCIFIDNNMLLNSFGDKSMLEAHWKLETC